jgi:hypothetical protein
MLQIGGRKIEDPIASKQKEHNGSIFVIKTYSGSLREMPDEFHTKTTIARLKKIQHRLAELGLPPLTEVKAVKYQPRFYESKLVSFIAYNKDRTIGWYKYESNTVGGGNNILLYNNKRGKVEDLLESDDIVEYAIKFGRKNVTNAHLALAVPYKKKDSLLPLYMRALPNDVRNLILKFLRSSHDNQRILFPLIVRNLELPVMLLEKDDDAEEVIEQTLSLSPLLNSEDSPYSFSLDPELYGMPPLEPHSRKPSPRKSSPRKPSPRKPSPRKPSPRKPSPRKSSPRKSSPRKPSPRKSSPRKPSPRKSSSSSSSSASSSLYDSPFLFYKSDDVKEETPVAAKPAVSEYATKCICKTKNGICGKPRINGTLYCGIHKNGCTFGYTDYAKRLGLDGYDQKEEEELCICRTKTGLCTKKRKPGSLYCGIHKKGCSYGQK